jgi:nitrate/TMAO reductase-like tetraheme cytochrome c subunit
MLKKYFHLLGMPVWVLATLLLLAAITAHADDDDGFAGYPVAVNQKWTSECSGCHIAYPPSFLTARSWRALMAGLDKHFGSDASVDEADAKEILAFLEKNADRRHLRVPGKPVLRITETRWFKSAHDEVSPRDWKRPQVKSPANCGACHSRADLGDFNEHDVRIPR